MNRDPSHQAFRQGRLAPQQGEARGFFLSPKALSRTADDWALLVDVIELLESGLKQASGSADPKRRQVAGVRIDPDRGFEIRLFNVDVPNCDADVPREPTQAESAQQPASSEHVPGPTTDSNDLEMPIPGFASGRAINDGACATFEESAGFDACALAPAVDQGLTKPDLAHALNIEPHSESASVPLMMSKTASLLLVPLEIDKVAHASTVREVKRVLTRRMAGEYEFKEQLEKLIYDAPNKELMREMLISVKGDWSPTPTSLGDVSWDGLRGVSGLVPFRSQLLIQCKVAGVDVEDKALVKVKEQKVLTLEHAAAVAQLTAKTSHQTKMGYLSPDVGTRLAVCMALRLTVRMLARVDQTLAIGSPFFITVLDVFPWDLTAAAQRRYERRLVEEMQRRPPGDPIWKMGLDA